MKSGDRIAFRAPRDSIGAIDADTAARLAGSVGDIAFVIDIEGRILDASFASGDPVGGRKWVGSDLAETVTVESRPKIAALIATAVAGELPRWRQVTHHSAAGDVAVRYVAVATGSGCVLVIGQDLRAMSALQQRVIQTQQSLERDYLKLRQAEARYRLLFDLDSEPVLIIEAETRRIREANPAACAMARVKSGALTNRMLASLVDPGEQDALLSYLGAATVSDAVAPVELALAGRKANVIVSATPFRQDRTAFMLVRMLPASTRGSEAANAFSLLIERLPDAFVITDARLNIVAANPAFLDLAQQVAFARIKGAPLGDYLGRAGIDVDLIVDQLREHGAVRNFATIMRASDSSVEDVEVSAVASPTVDGDGYGFSIRGVGRRVRELVPAERDVPRSVEQLTELVGRMPLKDIVRESTDLIERLCIEAALEYTSDNRASAAEILGVSRQSLYSKLHRHGLGNLVGGED